jgi:hypothetical protein
MAYGKNAYRGKWRPRNPAKYRGDVNNITYRSSWELKFMNFCDMRENVVRWSSEETVIPYKSPVDGQAHRYFVDFQMTVRSADGTLTTYLIEVKPHKFTLRPKEPKRKTKKYIEEVMMYVTNCAKWEAAKEFCDRKGYKFKVITENELGIKS